MSPAATPILDPASLLPRLAGTPLVVMLDIDGTLTPLRERPEEVTVPDRARAALARLARAPGVHAAVVTGRSAADARRLVPVEGVVVVGNHGAELVRPGAELVVHPAVVGQRDAVARARDAARALVEGLDGVQVEDKVWTLAVHYRRADPAVVPELRDGLQRIAAAEGLRLTGGKMILELRPAVEVNKGTAVLQLAGDLDGLGPGASLLFAGDDVTDEDAFTALRRNAPAAVTIRVSHDPETETAAEFLVEDTEGVRALLEWLAGVRATAS